MDDGQFDSYFPPQRWDSVVRLPVLYHAFDQTFCPASWLSMFDK